MSSCHYGVVWNADVTSVSLDTLIWSPPAALSATHSKWQHKMDFPQADWPIVNFPRYRYPVESHLAENRAEDAKSLLEVVRWTGW